MQIKEINWQHGRDYSATFYCPHCGHEQRRNDCYADYYYQNEVIPAMACPNCHKDQFGAIKKEENDVSACD